MTTSVRHGRDAVSPSARARLFPFPTWRKWFFPLLEALSWLSWFVCWSNPLKWVFEVSNRIGDSIRLLLSSSPIAQIWFGRTSPAISAPTGIIGAVNCWDSGVIERVESYGSLIKTSSNDGGIDPNLGGEALFFEHILWGPLCGSSRNLWLDGCFQAEMFNYLEMPGKQNI